MVEYEIGYGKPPQGTQFQSGISGNRKGRPKRTPDMLGEIVQGVLDAPVQYRENGRAKIASRRVVRLKLLVGKAVKGDVAAAALLLKKRHQALRHGEAGAKQVVVTDWLPDSPGQTADGKMAAMAGRPECTAPRRRGRADRGNKEADSGSSNEQKS